MQFSVSAKTLKSNLALVKPFIPSRHAYDLMTYVKVTANQESQSVTLTGFDLTYGFEIYFDAEVSESGTCLVPLKLFEAVAKNKGVLDFSVEDEFLIHNYGKIPVKHLDEYPNLPLLEGEIKTIPGSQFFEGMSQTAFAVSKDEKRQTWTCVSITSCEKSLEFAATNGHVLAVYPTDAIEEKFQVLIPGTVFSKIKKIGAPDFVKFDSVHAVLIWDSARMTVRRIEGQYPNYNQLIPHQFKTTVLVDRKELLEALQAVLPTADMRNDVAGFDIQDSTLKVLADAEDKGYSESTISASVSGEQIEIYFNIRYMMDGLKTRGANKCILNFNSKTSPMVLENGEMKYLVMSVQKRD